MNENAVAKHYDLLINEGNARVSKMTLGFDMDNENTLHLYRKYGFTEVLFDGADEEVEYFKLMKRM